MSNLYGDRLYKGDSTVLTPPTLPSIPVCNSNPGGTEFTWTWDASEETYSRITGYYIKIGTTFGGDEHTSRTWIGNVTEYTATINTEGNYYLSVQSEDEAKNTTSWVTSDVQSVGSILNYSPESKSWTNQDITVDLTKQSDESYGIVDNDSTTADFEEGTLNDVVAVNDNLSYNTIEPNEISNLLVFTSDFVSCFLLIRLYINSRCGWIRPSHE